MVGGQILAENLILVLPVAPALIWGVSSPSLGLEGTCHTPLEPSACGWSSLLVPELHESGAHILLIFGAPVPSMR